MTKIWHLTRIMIVIIFLKLSPFPLKENNQSQEMKMYCTYMEPKTRPRGQIKIEAIDKETKYHQGKDTKKIGKA